MPFGRRLSIGHSARVIALTLASEVHFVPSGEVTERPKVQHWKCCVLQKGTVGSNPTLSANHRPSVDNLRFSMATKIGPLAVVTGEPRQARKGAAAAGDPGAGVRLVGVATLYFRPA